MRTQTASPQTARSSASPRGKVASPKKTTSPVNLISLFPDYKAKPYRAKLTALQSEFSNELKDAYKHRGLVLYMGAGVSRSIGLPSWPELIRSLTLTMMTRKVHSAMEALGQLSTEDYWQKTAQVFEDVERYADYDKPILMMARAIKDQFGKDLPYNIGRSLYRNIRRRIFVRRPSGKVQEEQRSLPSSPLLDAIVALARAERDIKGVQAIVNYNYDDLVDEKLREQHVRCVTVRSGKDRIPDGVLPCYHVHGVIASVHFSGRISRNGKPIDVGNFVFSEDEYHAEYADAYKWSNMTQIGLLGRFTGLFVGLSLEDPNIRRLIDATHKQYPDNINFAILPRKTSNSGTHDSKRGILRNLFEEVESKSLEKIGIKVIWVNNHGEIPKVIEEIYAAIS